MNIPDIGPDEYQEDDEKAFEEWGMNVEKPEENALTADQVNYAISYRAKRQKLFEQDFKLGDNPLPETLITNLKPLWQGDEDEECSHDKKDEESDKGSQE